jgi:hypothetical protein
VELEPLRGTSFTGAAKLSPVTKLLASTGAVSRYKLYRSQRFITVQDLGCEHMSVSGCKGHYKNVLMQGQGKNRDKLIYFIDRVTGSFYF